MKSILIDEVLHTKLKETSNKSGVKIKHLVEAALADYLKRIKVKENDFK